MEPMDPVAGRLGLDVAGTTASEPPTLDTIDRRIVAALQVNGRATWQQVARAVGASESTVSRRANRLLRDGVVQVRGLLNPGRAGLGTSVLVQVECAVGAAESVARALATRSDVRFLALLTGGYDLVLEVVVSSRAHLTSLLIGQLTTIPGITRTTTETVLRNFKTSYDYSRELLGDAAAALEVPAGAPEATPSTSPALDPQDLHLMQVLATDGRLPAAALAERSGMSESAVRRRLDGLLRNPAVSFATLVEPRALGYDTEVFLWIDVELAHLESAAQALAGRPEVRYLSATAGESTLAAEVVLRDLDGLYRFSTEVLGALQGVRGVETGIELQTVKRGYATPRPTS